MSQLTKLKSLLSLNDNSADDLLSLILENAKEIICDLRNTDNIEPKYLNAQLAIAVEIFNKRGAEGQSGHSENGLSRSYENGDISYAVLSRVTPVIKTPYSIVRHIEPIVEEEPNLPEPV